VAADLGLFSSIRVRSVGNLEAAAGDPLVDELRDRRSGKRAFYAHSRLIVAELHNNYIRIPRAVCKLEADDVPIGLGIASVARRGMVRCLENGGAIEAPIEDWLEASGINSHEKRRKEGRSFWPDVAHELTRVAEKGKLGKMSTAGTGADMVLSLNVDGSLLESYNALLDAAKAARKAKKAASVRKHLAPR
jgi:hypothetical protein